MKLTLTYFRKVESLTIIFIPLILSAFIHIWNPIGFPSFQHDEDTHYLPRALIFMKYGDPQKEHPELYDHPFFGQILLGTLFKAIDYPQALITTSESNYETIGLLYMVPRIIMGSLAVLDTLLIFKIADIRYGRKVAFISAILFAVMPITWLLRRIMLDNLLLPFLLSSLLTVFYVPRPISSVVDKIKPCKIDCILILFSGMLLGLAIFIKIPAFTVIPL